MSFAMFVDRSMACLPRSVSTGNKFGVPDFLEFQGLNGADNGTNAATETLFGIDGRNVTSHGQRVEETALQARFTSGA